MTVYGKGEDAATGPFAIGGSPARERDVGPTTADSLSRLQQSDLEMIRVLEDLIHVLIDRGTVHITDLPQAAQLKLAERGRVRDGLGGLTGLINEEEQGVI